MSNKNETPSNGHTALAEKKKRRHLSPEKKFQIYLEAQTGKTPVGEILRREGLYATDLTRIREKVKEGALTSLADRPGAKKKTVALEEHLSLKKEMEEKERALVELALELAIVPKKNEWGFVGALKGRWIAEDRKIDILVMIAEAKQKGVCISSACTLLSIERRRITRWSLKHKQNESLKDLKPGPKTLLHNKLLPEESAQVLDLAKKEEYADLSHRTLCVTAWDLKLFFVSFSSVYRILRKANLVSMRGHHHHHNRNSLPPVRKELTGPNQRWCWDISYLLTHEKGMFLYLYLLLDEYSRKVIQWLISWHGTSAEAKLLIDSGLTDENILELPKDQRLEVFNDRGRQMKAKNVKKNV